jgi:phosphoribosylformylglycinamidine (FGAM) synthase-like amidotransferase family enzyme
MSGQREAEGGSRINARVGVITFPGTLDDVDAARAVRLAGAEAVSLWHGDADLKSQSCPESSRVRVACRGP